MVPEGRRAAAAAGVAWTIACGPPEQATVPSDPDPQLTRAAHLRVVSLSPGASRFLLAVGVGEQILAVDPRSSQIPALSGLPVVDLARAAELAPDVILWPGEPADQQALADAHRSAGREVVVYRPHSLDEAFALCRELGARLVGTARATSFELALSRPLAAIGGSSFGRPRPRVAAVMAGTPLEFAGGHSFVTDLIEIAGGSSVTHGGQEPRIAFGVEQLKTFAPDLLLVVSPNELPASERRSLQQALPGGYRIDFFVFDPDRIWTQEVVDAARRLRAVIEPLSDELDRTTLRPADPAKGAEGGG
jgi:ABC-type Fe3+-hydroxamate transport system substrate-binding protein